MIIVGTGAGGGTLARTLALFRSIGAMNATLTAMANAIRVGEHRLSRLT